MRPIQQRINGHLFQKKEQIALLLDEDGPDRYLRFAFARRGSETNLFPAFLLDDWGSEIRKLALYRWVDEFGEQFPRAEVFGFTTAGEETQVFLRDLEIFMKLPVFVFEERRAALSDGLQVTQFVRLNDDVTLAKMMAPAGLQAPLRRAALSWWSGNKEAMLAAGYKAL